MPCPIVSTWGELDRWSWFNYREAGGGVRALSRRSGPAGRRSRREAPRRVLIILENQSASTSHRVRKQVNTLLENGYSVSVITRRDPRNEELRKRRRLQILEYRPPADAEGLLGYLIEYGYSFLTAAFLSFRALVSGGIDVVQFCAPPDIYFPLAWVLKRLGVRVLIDQRDLLPELYAARFGQIRPALLSALRICERLSHRGADRIICTNDYQRDRVVITSGLPDDAVSIVRNGPVLAHVAEAQSDESLRRGHQHLCCWVGWMGHQDRVDLLVQSIDHVVHDLGRKDCQFAIIGPGEVQASMQELTHRLDLDEWVHFPGDLPPQDVFRYLATADLGVDASLQADVSPVKLYEYMAFGLPVVAFDLDETRAMADGASVLAEPGDIKAHARAIDALLSSPQRRWQLGETGRARVREELAWDHQARTYAGVIEQLCRAKPGRYSDGRDAGTATTGRAEPDSLSMADAGDPA
jgi:glycosyltransferase involved in cell wall biosynthesis